LYRIEKENEMQQPNDQVNPWDTSAEAAPEKTTKSKKTKVEEVVVKPAPPISANAGDFDMDGLMTDFPTAKELERFVFDETGIVLNLKGRANKLKYQVAMDVLNGQEVEAKFVGGDNPYIDRTELIPVEDLKAVPAKDPSLPGADDLQNIFVSNSIPHPDFEARMQDKKVSVYFRKYKTGQISYEIVGPVDQRPHGVKLDKYGRERPEIIKWVDPRTGEQIVVREDGSMTPQGRKLRAMMQTFRVNKSNHWDTWIDREFVSLNDSVASNPWELS
jgi:hypothetical protein